MAEVTTMEKIKETAKSPMGYDCHRLRGECASLGSSKPFPSPSSSSLDFEFAVSLSPASRQTGSGGSARFCPADELFYKGQLLPLQLSPRISMVRTLFLASASTTSSSDAATTASPRDSNGSVSSITSSSVDLSLTVEYDLQSVPPLLPINSSAHTKRGFTSLATHFSTVWFGRKRSGAQTQQHYASATPSPSSAAKEILKKCVSKVKPLYERLHSPLHQKRPSAVSLPITFSARKDSNFPYSRADRDDRDECVGDLTAGNYRMNSLSFSGNLRFSRRRRTKFAGSCPCSLRSSPSHSGLLYGGMCAEPTVLYSSSPSSSSSMEELQSAIQGAIAHCKSTIMAHSRLKKIV